MTSVTLRPNGTIATGGPSGGPAVSGAPNAHTALRDDTDSSYVRIPMTGYVTVSLTDLELPGGAMVKGLTRRLRLAKESAAGTHQVSCQIDYPTEPDPPLSAGPSVTWVAPTTVTVLPLLDPAADSEIDGASMRINWGGTGAVVWARVYEAYLDVVYVAQPTLSVDDPSATPVLTTEPTVSWTATLDADGGGQYAFSGKVFSAAQYSAGGFDPETSPATVAYEAIGTALGRPGPGEIAGPNGAATSWSLRDPLPDGTYRAYVKVAQSVNGILLWSAWAYKAFTVDAIKPTAPALTITPEHAHGRIRIDLDDQATDPTADYFVIERSTDSGLTWTPLRTLAGADGRVLLPDATAYDFEAPNNTPVIYRARAVNTTDSPPVLLVGDWATAAPARWISRSWWLKCPERPSLNRTIEIYSQPARQRSARQAAFQALGARHPIIVSDTRAGWTGQLQITVDDQVAQAAIDALLDSSLTLLLQGPPADDEPDRYVRIGDQDRTRQADKSFVRHRTDTLPWTEVASPTGAVDAWPQDTGS